MESQQIHTQPGTGGSRATRRGTVGSVDAQRPSFDKPTMSHHENQSSQTWQTSQISQQEQQEQQEQQHNTNHVKDKLQNLRRPGQVLVRQTKDDGTKEPWRVLTPEAAADAVSRSASAHAQNYDEAPPGQPGPDFSGAAVTAAAAAPPPSKPAFTRGISVMDNTAVVSAGPTPAAELANPMAFVKGTGGSRARESHLPDLDLRDADVYKGDAFADEPADETSGQDAFAPSVARDETDEGRQSGGQTARVDGWSGTN
ncbi:hypothetical protein BD289DRAFT_486640 [Coniella lustricola]|uniref:Uncharacterized protein n=1 Tax=Coniella lustricola TaxID=2025994 RepID=A0A2T2ZUG4_9PEZI|nr:hypothetical protein BD289DRAFT_486640 [Coniella lustricola]